MNIVWFWTLTAMLSMYAVLDGYDLGVGALHLWLARDNRERRVSLNAIGPVWNGNEVWLIASGGIMVAVFPRLYAAAFSGFYLALIVVLWLLILRGVAIEFRGQIEHELWRSFWDATFWLASFLLAVLLGVALGNVVHGVPVGADGYFTGSFSLLLNRYSLLTGALSLAVLGWHGVNYLRTKAEGALLARTRRWSRHGWWWAAALTVITTIASWNRMGNFERHPAALALPLVALAGFGWSRSGRDDRHAFAGSAVAIAGLLGTAAATVFPNLLRSTLNASYSLTIYNAAAARHGLWTAFVANGIAMVGVVAYSLYIHRVFQGRVRLEGHGY